MKFKVRRSANSTADPKRRRKIIPNKPNTGVKLTFKVVPWYYNICLCSRPIQRALKRSEGAKRLMKMFCLIYDEIRVAWENRLTLIKIQTYAQARGMSFFHMKVMFLCFLKDVCLLLKRYFHNGSGRRWKVWMFFMIHIIVFTLPKPNVLREAMEVKATRGFYL